MNRGVFLSGAASVFAAHHVRDERFAELERRYGGRLGVAAVNTANGARLEHRAGERFPMCSTCKVMLAATVLSRVDAGREHLDRHVMYTKTDLLDYAPITQHNLAHGSMTVRALCEAAIEYSDNTAANLLLRSVGGPGGVTAFARTLGDARTRLDRNEPTLNTAIPGDARDTTTPDAMAANLQTLTTGPALSTPSRRALSSWMIACKTGKTCIRAGVPAAWRAGDKTGSGDHASANDIAVLFPPDRPPVFVAAYYTESNASYNQRRVILADVGRIVSRAFAR